MKTFLLALAICFLSILTIAQEWASVYNESTDINFSEVQFFDASNGYVLGNDATNTPYLLKTINGGTTWQNMNNGFPAQIIKTLAFKDIDNGFVTFDNGKLYKTTDGGANWNEQALGDYDVFTITYAGNFNNNDVFYCFGKGKVYKSTDFGDNWEIVKEYDDWRYYTIYEMGNKAVDFLDEDVFFFIRNYGTGTSDDYGEIRYTDIPNFADITVNEVDKYGYSSFAAISKTLILGKSPATFVRYNDPLNLMTTNTIPWDMGALNAMEFASADVGFGVADDGDIYLLRESGNIQFLEYDGDIALNNVFLADDNTVYVVGNNGTILKRTGEFYSNTEPEFTSTPVETAIVGQEYVYNITTTDADGNDIAITWHEEYNVLPDWLTFIDNGDGTATLTGTPAETGTQNVALVANDGKSDKFQMFQITISVSSSIRMNNKIFDCDVFPNPTSGTLYIKNTGNVPIERIEVYNMNGKQIVTKNVSQDETCIELPDGMFMMKISDLKTTRNYKIFVK